MSKNTSFPLLVFCVHVQLNCDWNLCSSNEAVFDGLCPHIADVQLLDLQISISAPPKKAPASPQNTLLSHISIENWGKQPTWKIKILDPDPLMFLKVLCSVDASTCSRKNMKVSEASKSNASFRGFGDCPRDHLDFIEIFAGRAKSTFSDEKLSEGFEGSKIHVWYNRTKCIYDRYVCMYVCMYVCVCTQLYLI